MLWLGWIILGVFVLGGAVGFGVMWLLPGDGDDYRVTVDVAKGEAKAYVREELEPIRLYTTEKIDHPDAGEPWHLFRQIVNGLSALHHAGHKHDIALVGFDEITGHRLRLERLLERHRRQHGRGRRDAPDPDRVRATGWRSGRA